MGTITALDIKQIVYKCYLYIILADMILMWNAQRLGSAQTKESFSNSEEKPL